ncbi:MAG: hypothetical protein P8N13_08260, partial [Ilumatobacter sp.]|nr:hypothetical protein [Ilumatobacter sp.]
MRRKRIATALAVVAIGIAACSSDDDNIAAPKSVAATTVETATSTETPDKAPAVTTPVSSVASPVSTVAIVDPVEASTIAQVNDYIAQAAAFDQAGADVQFPTGLTFQAGGAPGYSRYVFREHSEGVVPTLVEGPLVGTVRCQDEALPCSFRELRELYESGAPIPPGLAMSTDELAELVTQLT